MTKRHGKMAVASAKVLGALLCMAAFVAATAAPEPLPEPRHAIANPDSSVADLFSCLRGKATIVSAHRGGPAPGYPESALETFAHTLSQVPVLFETDVRLTSDGVPVLMHDDAIDRTSDGHGAVNALTWAALSQVHLKDDDGRVTPYHMPSLDALLAWLRGRGLIALDMKEDAETRAVAAAVRKAKAEPYAAVIAYSVAQAKMFYAADPDITILYPVDSMADLDALRGAGIPGTRIIAWTGVEHQNQDLWRQIHARKITVAFGTLFFADYSMAMTGNTSHYAYLAKHGVDILPTDHAPLAFKIIDAERNTVKALGACHALAPAP
jgi:glycerophosphoryl diester phosphodiesterase